MRRKKESSLVKTEVAYLNRLGKILLRYFPIGQVSEILEDYQEHFSLGRERGGTDEEFISALGTPEVVTAEILKEMPEGRPYFYRHTACWGLLFLFNCFWLFIRYTDQLGWSFYRNTLRDTGSCILMALCAIFLFLLLHGQGQAAVESRFPQLSQRPGVVSYVLPAGLAAVMEAMMQLLLIAAENGSLASAPANIGPLINAVLTFAQLISCLLAVWNLWRAYSGSIRCYPAVIHALGALLPVREIQRQLRSMDVSAVTGSELRGRLLMSCFLIYGFGLILTLLFRYYIRKKSGMRRGAEAWTHS